MATRVDLDKLGTKLALEQALASKRRAEKAAHNPAMKLLLETEIGQLRHAIDTITEIK